MTHATEPDSLRDPVADDRQTGSGPWLASFAAWTAITAGLSVYVAVNYARQDAGWGDVALRQIANWMPFAPVYPLLRTIALRTPAGRGRAARFTQWFTIGVVLVFLYSIVRHLLLLPTRPHTGAAEPKAFDHYWAGLAQIWPYAVIVYVTLLAMVFGRIARDSRADAEQTARRLEAELARAQLQALQAQIRPHFLFNSLQAIEDACWRDPADASAMIVELSALLRASFEGERGARHTLARDLEFARSYMRLQQARFGERLRYVEHVDADAATAPLPPLFLQPLLENAVTHGIEPLAAGGEVRVTAHRSDGRLVLRIENDAPADAHVARTGGGVGLANTRARLRSLYGDAASLELRPRSDGAGVEVEVLVPLRESA